MSGSGSTSQEKKGDSGDGGCKIIILKAVGQDTEPVLFRVKMSSKLGKLKTSYCVCVGADARLLKFFFDGRRINDFDTPFDLEMENYDVIDVYEEQLAGGGSI